MDLPRGLKPLLCLLFLISYAPFSGAETTSKDSTGAVAELVSISEKRLEEQQNQPQAKVPVNVIRRAFWNNEHASLVKRAEKTSARVMFFGDSITKLMDAEQHDILIKLFKEYNPEAFGIMGDTTVDLLWRLNHGELGGNPELVVILIGSNDVFRNVNNRSIYENIGYIVDTVRARKPDSKVLLLGVLPRAVERTPADKQSIEKASQVNRLLKKLADGKKVWFMDIGKKFLNNDGTVNHALMPDYIHPNGTGYEIFFESIKPHVARLLRNKLSGLAPSTSGHSSPGI